MTARNYGVQPFISREEEPDDHAQVDMMREPTWFHMLSQVEERHSELIKPWEHPDYHSMEQYYPPPLYFRDWPGEMPTTEWYEGDQGAQLPCFITCLGNGGDRSDCTKAIRCRYQKVYDEGGPWAVYDYTSGLGDPLGDPSDFLTKKGAEFKVDGKNAWFDLVRTGGFWDVELRPTDSYSNFPNFNDPKAKFVVAYIDSSGITCSAQVDMYCSCQCPSGNFEFDDGSTPDTVAAGGTITMYVTGGCGPFSWTSSGSGYTLGEATTDSRNNTLTCDSGTCGVNFDAYTNIVVTDSCSDSVSFTIISSEASWGSDGSCDRCDHGITFDCNDLGDYSFYQYSGATRWLIDVSQDNCCDEASAYWVQAGLYLCSGEPSAGACALTLPSCGTPDQCGAASGIDCSGQGSGRTIETARVFTKYTVTC